MVPKWRGLFFVPSRTVMRELVNLGMDLFDVRDVLELGYDCFRSKRRAGTHEKCVDHGEKSVKVVVCKSYSTVEQKDVWLVMHAGIMGRKRAK